MTVHGPLADSPVVVVGSGVIGLTTALILARRGYLVQVVARDLPSDDTSQDWSSPWAGANWCPFGVDPRISKWEAESFIQLRQLIPSGLAMNLPITRYASTEAGLHQHWYRSVVPGYRILSADECPKGAVGVQFTSLSVNAPVYCRWLEAQGKGIGVTFTRRELRALAEIVTDRTRVVINATGLGARNLADVMDDKVEPIRGQVVLVRAPGVKSCTMDGTLSSVNPERSTYVIPRPNSGGQVICGGCYQTGSENKEVEHDMARDILEKCLARHPELATKGKGVEGIEIIRHCVGFRPSRKGGPRLERQSAWQGSHGYDVIHAYGIGPAGYQASWGMAKEACDLVGEVVQSSQATYRPSAKL